MLVQQKNTNPYINFGWEGPTHKALSQAGANKVNKEFCKNSTNLIFNVPMITESSILPDKEKHLPGSHAADITNLKKGDAFFNFNTMDKKIKTQIDNGNYTQISEDIGRALHYLQDMINPFHVLIKSKLSESDKTSHFKFEQDALTVQSDCITLAKNTAIEEESDFYSFLKKKMQKAKDKSILINTPMSKRKPINLKQMQKDSIIDSYQITYAYLKHLAKMLKH